MEHIDFKDVASKTKTTNTRIKQGALVIAVASILSACGQNSSNEVAYSAMPEGLKDCKVYYIQDKTAQNITVMRCPNSTTSTNYRVSSGKSTVPRTTIVVDDQEYIEKGAMRPDLTIDGTEYMKKP